MQSSAKRRTDEQHDDENHYGTYRESQATIQELDDDDSQAVEGVFCDESVTLLKMKKVRL